MGSTTFEMGSPGESLNKKNNAVVEYMFVAEEEADLKTGKISVKSPIGKGLIGKNKNDLVEIKTPAGVKNFEIKDVKYV